jgi:hypothetical protein
VSHRNGPVAAPLVVLLTIGGCSGSPTAAHRKALQPKAVGLPFVAASSTVFTRCRATARGVGYAVPCPTRVPVGLGTTDLIAPGGVGGASKSWRGWVVGSSNANGQHLVITASPRPLTNYAKLVNGPAWYPRARVRPLGWVQMNGRRMRSVYVQPATNDGSAFMHHVVLIWTEGRHTYGVGFHNTKGIRATLLLDEELVKFIELARP